MAATVIASSTRKSSRFSCAGLSLVLLSWPLSAEQAPTPVETPQSRAGRRTLTDDEAVFRTQVDLAVLHVTVQDRNQQLITDLPREAFHVFQDGKPQPITQFSNRDIPVSMGILVDSSASMTDKRAAVNAAALALVRASNPEDEVFIVNFKDEAEIAQDYTNDIAALERGLSDVRMWGGTALLDALRLALEHSQRGSRDKKVLLAITDGEDDVSRTDFQELLALLQRTDVTIYTIGILSRESSSSRRKAEKMLKEIAKVSGGASYFARGTAEVGSLATRIAHDIRNQYVLAFPVPAGTKPGFHSLRLHVADKKRGKLTARTRPGYTYQPSGPSL